MEQLKERYYDMSRALLAARSADVTDGTDYSEHPLAKFRYDARHERERKAEYERLYVRTEEEVRDESKRLEQAKASPNPSPNPDPDPGARRDEAPRAGQGTGGQDEGAEEAAGGERARRRMPPAI